MNNLYPYTQINGEILQIDGKPVVDVGKLTLNQWLQACSDDNVYAPNYKFPTDAHKMEYISTIHERSDKDFRDLLRQFLIGSRNLFPTNHYSFEYRLKNRPDLMLEFDRRILNGELAWEGITWILDLLPDEPESVLGVVRTYFYTHAQLLPDGRRIGLSDAMSIIRAKYLSIPQTSNEIHKMLLNLGWRRFEILVSKLYKKMGYEVELTRPSKDDGADMVCYRTDPGRRELLIGQCKCYTGNVGLKHFKELLGTVTDRKATKGVLITPGKFTKPAIEKADSNPSIELLGGVELQSLLAQHLGSRWIINLDLLTIESTKN